MATPGDNQFEVKLGRIRSPNGAKKVQGFFRKISKGAVAVSRSRGSRQHGRQARTATNHFQRRVIVKTHLVRMDAKGAAAQRLHLDYVERDGTGANGEPAKLYNRERSEVDKEAFIERGADDRHQFRIIVSPEDARELQDLTAYTRDLVNQVEHDLGTKLDWVAANHYDTGQPHTHLIISGQRDDGTDLIIPRKYIAHGMRERAQELVELELGPVPEIEGRKRMARMVTQERLTALDRSLFHRAENGVVDFSDQPKRGARWRQQLGRMRAKHLEGLGLTEPLGKGRWRIAPGAEAILRRIGERSDIIKAVHRAMHDNQALRMMDASSIFNPTSDTAKPITGVIIDKGVADDVNDRAFIVVDSLESKSVYVSIGGEARLPEFAKGEIVTVRPANLEPRQSDHTIAKIADAHGGRYSTVLHMEADQGARPEYVETHVRRLEALRRAGHANRESDGTWRIPADYLKRAAEFEKAGAPKRPADIEIRSSLRLSQMKTAMGATWLDEHLRDFDDAAGARGFAGDVETARAARRNFLMKQGFIAKDQFRLTQDTLTALEARDIAGAGDDLANELGKAFTPAPRDGRVAGVYSHAIDRPSGRYAVIERAKDFTLVPWRDVLERNRGKAVSGIIRNQSISWRLTKGRGLS